MFICSTCTALAWVLAVIACLCVSVCHTPVLYQNG